MATADRSVNAPTPSTTTARLVLLATFIAAIVLSASLLFMVQPMFTKLVLPRFGGAPSVWSVAIVFFQTALLAGYAYAHWLTRYAPGRLWVAVHLAVMIAAVFALPISIAGGWDRPPETGQALWLIGLFTVSIGLPFFALAANSPLLQAWFARTDHPAAKGPVFPLRRQQHRKLPRARVLSDRDRAVRAARRPSTVLVDRLLFTHRAARRLWHIALEIAGPGCARA
jgi:hypothetical protein